MISKSAAEYLRRKRVRKDGVNTRESGRIRYQNQHTVLSKQDEAPGMSDALPLTSNLPEHEVNKLPVF